MLTNISTQAQFEEQVSKLFSLIGQPARVQILLVLGVQPACVCHLEAALGLRQASISQHLMALRKAGLVSTSREGRNIFYSLTRPEVVALLEQAEQFIGRDTQDIKSFTQRPIPGCSCPQCNPGMDPRMTCRDARDRRSY